MKTSFKDIIILELLIQKLRDSGKVYICTLCGYTTNVHPNECPKCHYKIGADA